uniref:Uncharacterized protein n=1 Tax=Rhizophora mucronata TaxID=61149 RepID=A0A2P2R3P2_RHIMU
MLTIFFSINSIFVTCNTKGTIGSLIQTICFFYLFHRFIIKSF